MGFYDAIDRRGAGRSRGRSLHAWVLLAAAVLVMGAALIVWACSSQHQYRTIVSALADATRSARQTGAFTVTVDGETVPATADKLSDLLRLLTAMGPGRMGSAPASPPRITIDYGDGTVLEIWEVTLVNPSNDWTEGPYLRCTFPGGRRFGYDTDQIPMSTLLRLLA